MSKCGFSVRRSVGPTSLGSDLRIGGALLVLARWRVGLLSCHGSFRGVDLLAVL